MLWTCSTTPLCSVSVRPFRFQIGWRRLDQKLDEVLKKPLVLGFFTGLAAAGGPVYLPSPWRGQVAEWLKAHAWKVCNG